MSKDVQIREFLRSHGDRLDKRLQQYLKDRVVLSDALFEHAQLIKSVRSDLTKFQDDVASPTSQFRRLVRAKFIHVESVINGYANIIIQANETSLV